MFLSRGLLDFALQLSKKKFFNFLIRMYNATLYLLFVLCCMSPNKKNVIHSLLCSIIWYVNWRQIKKKNSMCRSKKNLIGVINDTFSRTATLFSTSFSWRFAKVLSLYVQPKDSVFTKDSGFLKRVILHKKWSFTLSISPVNVTKSAVFCGFDHIYWRNA